MVRKLGESPSEETAASFDLRALCLTTAQVGMPQPRSAPGAYQCWQVMVIMP